MSLDVKHINGDSTFLLTFTSPPSIDAGQNGDGTFTVLLDPWLEGDSHIYHPKFALAKRVLPSCIHHLSEIPASNVVVVSQDKTDHCNEKTLKQLDANLANTVILAHPAAAKRIRGWKYFDNSKVHAFPEFSEKKPNTVIRFHIPSRHPGVMPGEATLSFINAKFDIAGVHNAVGITYRPPGAAPLLASPLPSPAFPNLRMRSSAFELSPRGATFQSMPPTPPRSPPTSEDGSPEMRSQRLCNASTPDISSLLSPATTHARSPSGSTLQSPSGHRHTRSNSSQNFSRPLTHNRVTSSSEETVSTESYGDSLREVDTGASRDTPPTSPSWTNYSARSYTPFRPKTLSVIYSPHGLDYKSLRHYVTSHLISNAALPLTCLLHSFDRIQNPWYLGGNVNAGSPGGLEIARNLLARCWISAHDEDKESTGIAVLKAVTRKYTANEVEHLLEEGQGSKSDKKGGKTKVRTEVLCLDVGEHKVLP